MAQLKNTTISDTGSLNLPAGTTAQRPTSPAGGQIRYNTTINDTEYYDGGAWRPISDSNPEATGGAVVDTDIGGVPYRLHVFTNTGNSTFAVSRGGEVEYLIVGGGGGGGGTRHAGGGGAGGVLTGVATVTAQSHTVTVGTGGAGGPLGGARGTSGLNSSAFGFTAIGGGGGASSSNGQGLSGGSGGGASRFNGSAAGTAGQGNAGGIGNSELNGQGAGGGGGSSAGGPALTNFPGGSGGGGLSSSITGTNQFYAGGGGAGGAPYRTNGTPGIGGLGGGGDGTNFSTPGFSGTPNTGGGGGGCGGSVTAPDTAGAPGGNGGSGIVIVRYRRNTSTVTPSRTLVSTTPFNYQTFQKDLVLHLDATNLISYPGNGATWFDLSGNGHHAYGQGGTGATVDNTRFPIFQNNDSGRFYFDGNKSFLIPTDMGDHVSSTHEMWFYKNSANEMYIADARNGTGSWWITDYQSNDNFDIHGRLEADDPIPHTNASNWWFRWTHVVIMSDTVSSKLFINGQQVLAPRLKRADPLNVNLGANFSIGARFTASGRWFGYFSTYKIYNRELTLLEIQQSFNATRHRYGA